MRNQGERGEIERITAGRVGVVKYPGEYVDGLAEEEEVFSYFFSWEGSGLPVREGCWARSSFST